MQKPFSTNNLVLASVLLSAGFPPVDPEAICTNIYTAKVKFTPDPLDSSKPAKPGIIEFHFTPSDALTAALEIWDAEVVRIQTDIKASVKKKMPTVQGPTLTGDYPRDLILMGAWLFHTYGTLKDLWRQVDPKVWAQKGGKTRSYKLPEGGTRTVAPGFVLVSRNASAADLKKMGVTL